MSKPQPDFALDEIVGILTELPREEETGEGFVTVLEIHKSTGWGRERIRHLLGALKKEGRLEVGTKKIKSLDERILSRPAYRLKSKEEKE